MIIIKIKNFFFFFQKILTMLPTEDEKAKIAEAQMSNPDIPLGTAEQFLLTLSSISELEPRLRLWAFRLDYETMERVRVFFFLKIFHYTFHWLTDNRCSSI